MSLRMPFPWSAVPVVLWAALLAAFDQRLARELQLTGDRRAMLQHRVTTAGDSGTGSLREAIFAVNSSARPARIEIDVPRVTLDSPLPPIVSASGVTIEGGRAGVEIDGRGAGMSPILDLAGSAIVVRRLRVRGAVGPALTVRAPGVQIDGVELSDNAEGLAVLPGSDQLIVENCVFDANGVGLRLGIGISDVAIRRNRFLNHVETGLLAVSPFGQTGTMRKTTLAVSQNEFKGDRIAAAFINVSAGVVDNTFVGASDVALYLVGAGVVRNNRVRQGLGFGLYVESEGGTIVEHNELDHNAAGGLQVRGAGAAEVRDNRIYENGYGIVVILGGRHLVTDNLIINQKVDGLFVLGGSPVLNGNRLIGNGGAGLHVLDYVTRGRELIEARPSLLQNVVERNRSDVMERGRYFEPEPKDNQP
jgi:hypothetical protein